MPKLILVLKYIFFQKALRDFRYFGIDKTYKLIIVSQTPGDTTYGAKQPSAFIANFDSSKALDTVTASVSILLTSVLVHKLKRVGLDG